MSHPPSTRTLVTGASRGLGYEFVRQCLDRGDRVYAGVRSPDNADGLQGLKEEFPGRLFVFPLDVSDSASLTEAVRLVSDETERLDLLINNAGVNSKSIEHTLSLGDLDGDSLLEMFRINSVAPILVVQAFLELLKAGEHARVIHISSWLGSIQRKNSGGNYGYCASKAALNMLGRTLAFDLQSAGIISLLFNPGWVKTDMGGSKAELTPTQAVCGILSTSDTATIDDTGRFFQWDGVELPW